MNKSNLDLAKLLALRFKTIWGHKFTKDFDSEIAINAWYEDWAEIFIGQSNDSIKSALQYCKQNLTWPPSIAEFISFCEKASGTPDCDEALRLALKHDLSHPLVKAVCDKVGSFALRNDKEEILSKKFKTAYEDCLRDFRKNTVEQKALAAPMEPKKLEHENVVPFTVASNDEWETDAFQDELWKNKMLYMQNRVRVYNTHGARGVVLDRHHSITDAQPVFDSQARAYIATINTSSIPKPISKILPGLKKNMERNQPLENIS